VNPEARLAEIVAALGRAGVSCLVMGGHAVRFYGVSRTTLDFDLVLSLDDDPWNRLGETVRALPLRGSDPVVEGPSWRPGDFRRFVIGRLPDGQEERLEFWRRNHLLAPFGELHQRRSEGTYGGALLPFIGLWDLLRSKETERDSDWLDVALLEEIYDERALAQGRVDDLRSRRGFERAVGSGRLDGRSALESWPRAASGVALAYLTPYVAGAPIAEGVVLAPQVRELLDGPMRSVAPESARHLALVEAVRRLHKRLAVEADRRDKRATAGR
jgi:hypothetical protein